MLSCCSACPALRVALQPRRSGCPGALSRSPSFSAVTMDMCTLIAMALQVLLSSRGLRTWSSPLVEQLDTNRDQLAMMRTHARIRVQLLLPSP